MMELFEPYVKVMKLGLVAGLFFGAGFLYAKASGSSVTTQVISQADDLKARQAQYEQIQSKLKLSYYNELSKEPRRASFDPEPKTQTAVINDPPAPKVEEQKASSAHLANALSNVLGQATPDSVASTAKADLPSVTGSRFAVQVASLPDRKAAEELANRLSLKGYDARLVQADITGRGTVYRVRIHGYDNREEADSARVNIAAQERLDAITVAQ
jgi:cell division protein FtsN